MGSERYTCEQVIEALQKTKGMVYLAADLLQCVPQTVYNYIERHPTVKAAWQDESGRMLDRAELKLYQAIMRDDSWAIAFYLKTKGKRRGYSEKVETEQRIVVEWTYGDDATQGDAPEAA